MVLLRHFSPNLIGLLGVLPVPGQSRIPHSAQTKRSSHDSALCSFSYVGVFPYCSYVYAGLRTRH
ncbi:uncharacterized protein CIMG_13715 [Coccidioides immitis RS]|uniref:Uncharacterized protein n=1 Tax=Coccidioides immitis (strain RS) TaxID=246410 RepID=J3KBG8_COCIM|nr:uncharacterized protein CIMG_13715 [Coccidioides immitis RS]EAS32461.3 hypothetical protein CIMG_13715 [Coccidioides immitis RS]